MALLLIDEDGATLRREDERFVVSVKALDLLSARSSDVDAIILVGRTEVTRAAIDLAMSTGSPIYLATARGKMKGSIQPPMLASPQRREMQYLTFCSETRCLEFSKASVVAQIKNQRAVLRRLALRRDDSGELTKVRTELKEFAKTLSVRNSVEEVRGVEGYATRAFFAGVRSAIDPSLGFSKRAVRADKDPFNCTLDALGGTLALICRSVVEAAGLDPFKGVLHGDSRNNPALALDLEDIYRPILVVSNAVTLFSKDILDQNDFSITDKKCSLSKGGYRKIARRLAKSLRRDVTRNNATSSRSYSEQMLEDARSIASWVEEDDRELTFFSIK